MIIHLNCKYFQDILTLTALSIHNLWDHLFSFKVTAMFSKLIEKIGEIGFQWPIKSMAQSLC